MPQQSILIVDDDSIILNSLCEFLNLEGYETIGAGSYKEAIEKLQQRDFSLLITDVSIPDGNGFDLLDYATKNCPSTVIILITGYGSIESAVQAIKSGAHDYLTKPIIDDELLISVERALKQHSLMNENITLKSRLEDKYSMDNIISHDYKMAKIFELVEAVADSKTTILMTGPSGTGKSMLSRAIHYRSSRRDKPFIEISCGAIPEALLESELFGHVRGSFTGAVNDKEGKFLAANGGTIFLDEIATATPALQVKLLRVLQEREFEAIGSNKTVTTDARVILATNVDLREEVAKGNFREDLYYRINVVNIKMPALVERIGDVPLLCDYHLKRFCAAHNKIKLGFTPEAIDTMQRYNWPGNIRELENAVERAVLLSKNTYIDVEDLPQQIIDNALAEVASIEYDGVKGLKEAMIAPERIFIKSALERFNWNRQETAKALKINRTTLYKKMKRCGLEDEALEMGR